jgi:type II secretory pathway pseudopilin PulG
MVFSTRAGRAALAVPAGWHQEFPLRLPACASKVMTYNYHKRMNTSSHQSSRPGGFSLLELLIVAFIMLGLSAMMYSFGSARRQKTQKALCQDNLQKIYIALQIYAKDANGRLPEAANAATAEVPLDLLVPRYSADTSIFICPGGRDSAWPAGESLLQGKISYAYYMGRRLDDPVAAEWPLLSDRQVNTGSKLKGDPVFSSTGRPPGNNHHKYGGNFLMGDGSVQGSGPEAPFALLLPLNVILLNPKP